MTKKFFYAVIMVLGMLLVAPQTANAQFGLAGALSGAFKKSKKEKEKKPATVSQKEVLELMGKYTMSNRETIAAITEAYKNQMGAGKEILAVSSKNWNYKRDDFGNILYRHAEILVQFRSKEDEKVHVHMLICSQAFNGVDYDEIRVEDHEYYSVSYRDRIIE